MENIRFHTNFYHEAEAEAESTPHTPAALGLIRPCSHFNED